MGHVKNENGWIDFRQLREGCIDFVTDGSAACFQLTDLWHDILLQIFSINGVFLRVFIL